jgi:hypothetical protein
MALIFCRACKHRAASDAPACPRCGVENPGHGATTVPTTKEAVLGLLLLCAIVTVAWLAWNDLSTIEAAAPTPAPSESIAQAPTAQAPALDFGLTPDQFRSAYNDLLVSKLGKRRSDLAMRPFTITDGKSANSFKQSVKSASTYIIGRVSKKTGKMDDLLIGIGGDSSGSFANATVVTLLALQSASGLGPDSGINTVVFNLLNDAVRQLEEPNDNKNQRTIDGYRMTSVGIPGTGILVSLSRVY